MSEPEPPTVDVRTPALPASRPALVVLVSLVVSVGSPASAGISFHRRTWLASSTRS